MVREITNDATLRGRVIPLAFHVDYWNRLGWSDPFSAAQWSQRQLSYVNSMHLSSAYTPQMVVNGTRQFVGNSAGALDAALAAASKEAPLGRVKVSVARKANELEAKIGANVPGPELVDVMVAVVEDGLTTSIKRGENAGLTIDNEAVVRRLTRLLTLNNRGIEKTVPIAIEPGWNPARLGVVVFLQDRKTMAIRGAAYAR